MRLPPQDAVAEGVRVRDGVAPLLALGLGVAGDGVKVEVRL